jgi:hypothetical protein
VESILAYKEIIAASIAAIAGIASAYYSSSSNKKCNGIEAKCVKIQEDSVNIKNNVISKIEGIPGKILENIVKIISDNSIKIVENHNKFMEKAFNAAIKNYDPTKLYSGHKK